MQRRLSAISLVVLLGVGESACHKKRDVVLLPAPAPATTPTTIPDHGPPTPASESTPVPPLVENPTPPQPNPPPPPEYQKNRPGPQTTTPTSRRQSPPRNSTPAATAAPASSAPAIPAPAPAEPPRLGDMLTPDQQKQFNTAIDQSLQHAQNSLGAIRNRQLNKEQQDRLAQVRTFIQQAQAIRASDLPGAKSLAERAEVLARDLAAGLQ